MYTRLRVQKTMATFDYLADGWLDMYERKIFKGKTIKELCLEALDRQKSKHS